MNTESLSAIYNFTIRKKNRYERNYQKLKIRANQ